MKTLKYGNIKKSGNTLHAKQFKKLPVFCMECGQYLKGHKILKRELVGYLTPSTIDTDYPEDRIINYTLECIACGCIFTVNLDGEE